MQKLSFYLVPNRISVVADMVNNGYSTENRQVYTRTLKIYKGIDNTIELDVRASDQRRISMTGYTATLTFFDSEHKSLFSTTGTPILSKTGIISVTIPKETIENIDPQKLTVAAYLTDAQQTQTMIYADSQFGIFANVDLLDGFNVLGNKTVDEVKTFNYDYYSKKYVSEIGNFGWATNDEYNFPNGKSVHIYVYPMDGDPFVGTVTIEATDDKSTSYGTNWTTIGTINITEYYTPESDYAFVSGNYRYVRFTYPKYQENSTTETAGLLTKIIIRSRYNEPDYVVDGGTADSTYGADL